MTKDSVVSANQTHEMPHFIKIFANLSMHNTQDDNDTNGGGVVPSSSGDYSGSSRKVRLLAAQNE